MSGRDQYPPEYDEPTLCEVCGVDTDNCDCQACPACQEQGNPDCYLHHGLTPAHDSVQSFMHHVGIEPLLDCLRAIDRHNTEHVWLVLPFDLPSGSCRLYYHASPTDFAAVKPWTRLSGIGVGGIAWDGSDWEYAEEVEAGNGWARLDNARADFYAALDEHTGADDDNEVLR